MIRKLTRSLILIIIVCLPLVQNPSQTDFDLSNIGKGEREMQLVRTLLDDAYASSSESVDEVVDIAWSNPMTFEFVFTVEKSNINSSKEPFNKYVLLQNTGGTNFIGCYLVIKSYSSTQWQWYVGLHDYLHSTSLYVSSTHTEVFGDLKFIRITLINKLGYPTFTGTKWRYWFQIFMTVFDDEYGYVVDEAGQWKEMTTYYETYPAISFKVKNQLSILYANTGTGDKIVFLSGPYDWYSTLFDPRGAFMFDKPDHTVSYNVPTIRYTASQIYALDYRSEIDQLVSQNAQLQSDLTAAKNDAAAAKADAAYIKANYNPSTAISNASWDTLFVNTIRGGAYNLAGLDGLLTSSTFGLSKLKDILNTDILTDKLNSSVFGLSALKTFMADTIITSYLNDATFGLSALESILSDTIINTYLGDSAFGLSALKTYLSTTIVGGILNNASYGLSALKDIMNNSIIGSYLNHVTFGLPALYNLITSPTGGLPYLTPFFGQGGFITQINSIYSLLISLDPTKWSSLLEFVGTKILNYLTSNSANKIWMQNLFQALMTFLSYIKVELYT